MLTTNRVSVSDTDKYLSDWLCPGFTNRQIETKEPVCLVLRNITVYNTGCLVFFFLPPECSTIFGVVTAFNMLVIYCLNMAKHCISTLFLSPSLDQQLTLAKRPQSKVKHTTSLSWFAFSDDLLQKRPSQDGQQHKALKWPTQTAVWERTNHEVPDTALKSN